MIGRDVPDRTLIIEMDWAHYRWILLGEEKDVERKRELFEFNSNPIVQ